MRLCKECNFKRMCDRYNNPVNGNKEFEAQLYLLKRQAANEFWSYASLF